MERERLIGTLRRAAALDDLPRVDSGVLFQAGDALENDGRQIAALQAEAARLRARLMAFEDALAAGELARGPGKKGDSRMGWNVSTNAQDLVMKLRAVVLEKSSANPAERIAGEEEAQQNERALAAGRSEGYGACADEVGRRTVTMSDVLVHDICDMIEALRYENHQLRETCYSEAVVKELKGELDRVTAERDAAVADLHHVDACDICAYADSHPGCDIECQDCRMDCKCRECVNADQWKWRGEKEVSHEADPV